MKRSEGWATGWTGKIKTSLTAKIFLVTCALLMVVCVLTYGFIAWVMPMTYTADRNQQLTVATEQLAQRLEGSRLADCDGLLADFAAKYDAQVSILDRTGQTLKDTLDDPPAEGPSVSVAGTQAGGEAVSVQGETSSHMMQAIGVAVSFADQPGAGCQLMVVGNLEAVNQAAQALGRVWPWLVGAVLLMSVCASLFYARFITRPIVELSGISEKMSRLDFGWRCGEARRDEIGILSRSLNQLAEKLSAALAQLQEANAALRDDIRRERALERQRLEFFAAASHELKTPLTVLKGQLSGMLDGVGTYTDRDKYLARSLAVAGQMETLVGELLAVARLERGQGEREPVDLADLVGTCAGAYADLFEQKAQRFCLEAGKGVTVRGDRALLAKAVGNLLSNAALYSPEGAQIRVAVGQGEGGAVLQVENTGARIPEGALPHLFEAFYRVDPSRSRQTGGSGLGLYLVKNILDRHGGGVQVRNTEVGVCVEVCFPEEP